MKILHVIDELRIGGAQTHLVTFLTEMRRRWDDDHVVVSVFGDGPLRGCLEELGLPVRLLDLKESVKKHRFGQARQEIVQVIREIAPDVCEAHLTWSRLLGLWAARRCGVPRRIGFEHGDLYARTPLLRLGNLVGQFFAHDIVVCSEALGAWVTRTHGVLPSKMVVLHNCADTTRFGPQAARRPRRQPGWPDVSTLFCAVGTLGHGVNKRTDVCIRATGIARSRGADVGLVVCGDGDQRPDLERHTSELGLADFVVFLGTRTDVPEIMAGCDGFCHAAPFEPFGIVAVEAMATGLPVVVPNSGGVREIVDDGRTGLVYPALDHDGLARLMMRLDSEPGLRRRLGAAARDEALSRFSVSAYAERLRLLYGG